MVLRARKNGGRRVSFLRNIDLKSLVFAIAIAIAMSWDFALVSANDNQFSMVNGFGALDTLATNSALQKNIELTEEQLLAIKTTLNKKNLFGGDKNKNDAAARDVLKRILTANQLERLRKYYVKSRFRSPLQLFDSVFLQEVGLDEDQVSKVLSDVSPLIAKTSRNLDVLRVRALEQSLPPEQLALLWKFVGERFAIKKSDGEWEEIVVFSAASIDRQLALSTVMVLPPELALTMDQRVRLQGLYSKVKLSQTQNGLRPSNAEISKLLDSIISKHQRYAIVQQIQQQVLRSSLLEAAEPEFVKHLGLKEDVYSQTLEELSRSAKNVEEEKIIQELVAFREGLKFVPHPFDVVIKELAAGVWDNQ